MKSYAKFFKLLSLTIIFSMSACSNNNQNNNSEPSSEDDDILLPKATSDAPEFLLSLPIPSGYSRTPSIDERGTVEVFDYTTKVYDINGDYTEEITKHADVYLPYGYDENKTYDVLYLMHGGGETYTYWLTEQTTTVNVLDNVFIYEDANPCIVVAPTFYTGSNTGIASEATDIFQYEFRNDLIPQLEAHYATYCKGNVTPNNLIRTRYHRAFAGLSMGSMTSIRSALLGCLDICAYISSMSGGYDANDSTGQAGYNLIHEALTNRFKDYPIGYWLNQNGTSDMALTPHENLKNLILNNMGDYFTEGKNFSWIKFQGGAHDYRSWIVGLYNTLQVSFKLFK